jgi:hypothetical protein
MLAACPFLEQYRTDDWEIGSTIVFGDVALLLRSMALPETEAARVFQFFNALAEGGEPDAVDALATGALEMFNDDAESQRMARRFLHGRALELLEETRRNFSQPDYGAGK